MHDRFGMGYGFGWIIGLIILSVIVWLIVKYVNQKKIQHLTKNKK